ncbi:MAG: phytoene/squalene synthase family protein [Panacagrimonas sp.]
MQPRSPESIHQADLAACRALLRSGSKSFAAASKLLPREVRDSATILYAFCREADDAVDLQAGGGEAVCLLRRRLDRIYAGKPLAAPTDRAMVTVVARHALPRTLLDALIEGFEWDAQNRRYATLADLERYAARVAGTIGAMMSVLMGVRTPTALARACDLGVAMQLTNIARDVGEDARNGRLYLPLAWLYEAGIDPDAWLAAPRFNPGIGTVVRRLLDAADGLYARVAAGVAELPSGCRPGINAARFIYAEIGCEVQRGGYDSVSRRAFVTSRRKALLLMKAYERTAGVPAETPEPPLAATHFLIEAVLACPPMPVPKDEAGISAPQWWHFRSRALWLIDLFERLERRERTLASE